MATKLTFREIKSSQQHQSMCASVDVGLSELQKSLPTRYLYDEAGSQLFERITTLPEYYLTRSEQSILEEHAGEIVSALGAGFGMIEFGSGSSKKTRLLIEAALEIQPELHYVPIDISSEFLRDTSRVLIQDYPGLKIAALAAEYFDAAAALPEHDGPRLVLFLGSNVGNLAHGAATDFLGRVARRMTAGDRALVGVDLVKDAATIEAAYNDAAGVTAQFNLNILKRINRELDGHFDLEGFRHHAPYDQKNARVEMRLYSKQDQQVAIDAIGKVFRFAEGEFIHTEWSHKYTEETFGELASKAGLEIDRIWYDEKKWFSMMMLRKVRG